MSAESNAIAAARMEDPNPSPIGSNSFGWYDSPNVSREQLDSVFPLREGTGREFGYKVRTKIANNLAPLVEQEKRESFIASMGMAESPDGVVQVLVAHEIPKKIDVYVKDRVNSTELDPRSAKLAGKILARYTPKEERADFKKEMAEAENVGAAVKIIKKYEVDAELALRGAKLKNLGKIAVPVAIGLAGCLTVPTVDPNAVAQPDMFHAYLLAHPNDVIVSAARWGAVIGGAVSVIENGWNNVKAVFKPAEDSKPIAIHSAIASATMNMLLEAFENSMKAGAATTGLAVFAGGVPVENVKTIGTILSTGLGIQTILEFFTEPLTRIKNL